MSARQFGLACGLSGKNVARTVYRWETEETSPSLGSMYLMSMFINPDREVFNKMWTLADTKPRGNIRALLTDGVNITTGFYEPDVDDWLSENGTGLKFTPTKYREIGINYLATELIDF